MSTKSKNAKHTAVETWEAIRRRKTAAVVKGYRKDLEELRAQFERDAAKVLATLDALQAWTDGGPYPEIAIRYARLAGIVWDGSSKAPGQKSAERALVDLFSTASYEDLPVFDRAICDSLNVACGRTDEVMEQEREGKAA